MSIPLKLHQIWLGKNPIPEHLLVYAESWRRYHPGTPHILWVDDMERAAAHEGAPFTEVRLIPPVINRWVWEQVRERMPPRHVMAGLSDIARLEIVAVEGGIYADLDMEFFRPIKPLLRGVRLFVADEYSGGNGNYLFGADANHPALWTAVRHLEGSWKAHEGKDKDGNDQLWKILHITGPVYVNTCFQQHKDCVIFPYQLFNPLHPRQDGRLVTAWPAAAYGNHHYAGTWYDQTKTAPDPYFLGGSNAPART